MSDWSELKKCDLPIIGKMIRIKLRSNMIISISGPLGVGKTTLIRNILPEHPVQSPSFMHALYYGNDFMHIDAYTFKSQTDFLLLDIPYTLERSCIIIEWGELLDLSMFEAKIMKLEMKFIDQKRYYLISE